MSKIFNFLPWVRRRKRPLTAVVYLARAAEGIKPMKRFVDSYRKNLAHHDHDLVLIYKGFPDHVVPAELQSLFQEFPSQSHFVEDVGYDLGSYFSAVQAFDHRYFFFLNTFSRFRRSGWLKLVMSQLADPSVGIVGCTGSYESLDILDATGFDPFPNVHVRTNAFGMSREVIEKLAIPEIKEKWDAARLESGKNGINAQVRRLLLQTIIMGANGQAYLPEDWWKSETFRQKDQANRLVSDNQTDLYTKGDPEFRKYLSERAWGEKSML